MTAITIVITHRASRVTPPGHWRWSAQDAALVRRLAVRSVGCNLMQFKGLRMCESKVGIRCAAVLRATVIAIERASVDPARWR